MCLWGSKACNAPIGDRAASSSLPLKRGSLVYFLHYLLAEETATNRPTLRVVDMENMDLAAGSAGRRLATFVERRERATLSWGVRWRYFRVNFEQ